MAGYSIVLAVAAVVTYLATFAVRRIAVRIGAVVRPDDRRVHEKPTPTAGGAAMYVAFLLAMFVASLIPQFDPVFNGSSEPLGVVIAATVIFAVGLVDDLKDV